MRSLAVLATMILFFYYSPYILIFLFIGAPFIFALVGIALVVLMFIMEIENKVK